MKFVVIFSIVINIWLIYLTRTSKIVALMLSFFLTYIINLIPYYFFDIEINQGYFDFYNKDIYGVVVINHCIFLLGLLWSFRGFTSTPFFERVESRQSTFAYYLSLFAMIFIIAYGKTGDNIFESGGYAKGGVELYNGLAIHEYFIVFIAPAYIFSNKSWVKQKAIVFLCMAYIFKSLIFGGRIEVLQTATMLYLLLLDKSTLKWYQILIPLSIVVVSLLLIGVLRANLDLILLGQYSDIFSLERLGYLLSHQNDVYYSSARLSGLILENLITIEERGMSVVYSLCAIFVPYSRLPEIANLAAYQKDIYPAGGGGLISTHFYVYLSFFGPLAIGVFIGKVIKIVLRSINQYIIIYGLLLLSTFYRWFAYNPIIIFKLCFYGVVYYAFILVLSKLRIQWKKK